MPLPILQSSAAGATPETLLRLFHQTERDWSRHLSNETPLDVGTAFHNSAMPKVWDANCILDASLPDGGGLSPGDAYELVEAHFSGHGATCWRWVMNPSAPRERTDPLVEHLKALGYVRHSNDLMHLAHMPLSKVVEVGGLKIIPARASYRHVRELAAEAAYRWDEPQLVEATVAHVEDPHFDSMLAIKDGTAVAMAGVLAVGEIGRVDEVFVSERYRKLGLGRTMMSRILEICARSLFKHVLLSVFPTNGPAIQLYQSLGFGKVGEVVVYQKPSAGGMVA